MDRECPWSDAGLQGQKATARPLVHPYFPSSHSKYHQVVIQIPPVMTNLTTYKHTETVLFKMTFQEAKLAQNPVAEASVVKVRFLSKTGEYHVAARHHWSVSLFPESEESNEVNT